MVAESEVSPARSSDYRARWVVVIGIDRYSGGSGFETLTYAGNDAREVRNRLRGEFGFTAAGQLDDDHILYLTDEAANRATIRDALTGWLPSHALSDDAVVVFFAGHGKKDKATGRGYLIPSDGRGDDLAGTCVSYAWVRDRIKELRCRHKALILDSCFSGHVFSDSPEGDVRGPKASATSGTNLDPSLSSSNNLDYYLSRPAFLGLSSGRDTPVADGMGENRHSLFTAALLRALDDRADSTHPEHVFTFRQLAGQIEPNVAFTDKSKQVPEWGPLGEGDGDLVFRPCPKPWRLTRREQLRLEREHMSTQFALTHALSLCERGDVRSGLLWLAKALETVPPGDELEYPIRVNLDGWGRTVPRPIDFHVLDVADFQKKQAEFKPRSVTFAPPPPPPWRKHRPTANPFNKSTYVSFADVDPGIEHMAVTCEDGIRIYNARTWEPILPPAGMSFGDEFGDFLTDGGFWTRTSSWHDATPLKIWTLAGGRATLRQALKIGGEFRVLPDGKTVLAQAAKGYQLVDLATGRLKPIPLPAEIPVPIGPEVTSQQFLIQNPYQFVQVPKTRLVAAFNSSDRVYFVDTASGLMDGEPLVLKGESHSCVASPEGRWLAISGGTAVQIWDVAARKKVGRPLMHEGPPRVLGFAPDCRTLLTETTAENSTLWLWDAVAMAPVGEPMRHPGGVGQFAFAPDGLLLLTACADRMTRLWDATTGLPVCNPIASEAGIAGLGFAVDGACFWAFMKDGAFWRWDTRSMTVATRLLSPAWTTKFVRTTPDRKAVLAKAGERILFWDAETGLPAGLDLPQPFGDRIGVSEDQARPRFVGGPAVLTSRASDPFRPDLKVYASPGHTDLSVFLIDSLHGSRVGDEIVHTERVEQVFFAPNNLVLATTGRRWLRFWNATNGKALGGPIARTPRSPNPRLDQRVGWGIKFSPDGRRVADSSVDTRVWDVETGQLTGPPIAACGRVEFSPDGSRLLIDDRGTCREFDVATGQPTWSTTGEETSAFGYLDPALVHAGGAYRSDGTTIVARQGKKTIRSFNPTTGQPLGPAMDHPGPARLEALGPDGRTALASFDTDGLGSGSRSGQLWDLETGTRLGPPFNMGYFLEESETWSDWQGDEIVIGEKLWRLPRKMEGDPKVLTRWTEAMTGLRLDDRGAAAPLSLEKWQPLRDEFAPRPDADQALTRRWHADFAQRSERDEHLFSAAWHLERLARISSGDAATRLRLALALARGGHVDRAIKFLPDRAWLEWLANTYAQLGRFDEAAKLATRLDRSVLIERATDLDTLLGWTVAFARCGDLQNYRRGCAGMLSRFGHTDKLGRNDASRILYALLLAPNAVTDWSLPIELSKLVVTDSESSDWDLFAAILYQAGRLEEASRALALRRPGPRTLGGPPELHDVLKWTIAQTPLAGRPPRDSSDVRSDQLSVAMKRAAIEMMERDVEARGGATKRR
jgi:WD40 repeat protein